jgi:hypothetical protein
VMVWSLYGSETRSASAVLLPELMRPGRQSVKWLRPHRGRIVCGRRFCRN